MYTVEALYFPTKVILIDDDQDFLILVSRYLKRFFQVETFTDPYQAYIYVINNQKNLDQLDLSIVNIEDEDDEQKTVLSIDKTLDIAKSTEKNSFSIVIISDQDMPGMNGIQLFEKLSKTSVMRILLTGRTDSKLASDAFNRGFVHKFLIKNSEEMLEKIVININACQKEFFAKISYSILARLNLPRDSLLNQSGFAIDFMNFISENNISEYYLIDTIGSFLLKTKDGSLKYLIFILDRQFDEFIGYAKNGATDVIKQQLEKKSHAPVVLTTDAEKISPKDWAGIMYPFEKKDGYYFCFIEKNNYRSA